MSSLRTRKVFPGSEPLYWRLDKKRAKEEKAIPGNILKCYERRCKEENNPPNWFLERSIIDYVSGCLGGLGLVGFIATKISGSANRFWKWVCGIFTVGGLGVLGFGLWRSVGASVRASSEKKKEATKAFAESREIPSPQPVSIERTHSNEVKEEATIPVSMWNPEIHGKGKIEYYIGHDGHREVIRTKDDYETKKEEIKKYQKVQDKEPEIVDGQVTVEKFPHYVYKAKTEGHEIDIVIPKVYADNRPDSCDKIFAAIEESLSAIPTNLVRLVKRIRLCTYKPFGDAIQDTDDSAKEIRIYHKGFDMTGGLQTATNEEKAIEEKMIANIALNKDKTIHIAGFDENGKLVMKGNAPGSALHHEIAHLLSFYIQKQYLWATIPGKIFPEDSDLRNEELSIDDSFAKGRDVDSWEDANDAWAKIAKADGRPISNYGTFDGTVEDNAEAGTLFLKAYIGKTLDSIKKHIPNRFSFIEQVIGLVNP